MTYEQWAKEYLESAENVKRQIEELKEKIINVALQEFFKKGIKAVKMENSLNIFKNMYYECMDTARILSRRKGEC